MLLLDKLKSDVLKGADGMKLMISSFLGALPVETRYAKFWRNALKLSNRKSRYLLFILIHNTIYGKSFEREKLSQ